MDHGNGEQARSNVVALDDYRRTRSRAGEKRKDGPTRLDDGATHLYIDLFNGRLDYGLVKVTEENALTLLEPWIYLGSQLIRFYSE
ncbi:hypothetical protein [Burkholderia seminalis]|uniref:hypothetical protein n=1 Tax=Burkholderia seminalis TaxID=488731 RepID=UPI000F599362|nr:hypothetical protein [Burkholderia seminalis]